MANPYFQFKQFRIDQDRCGMKVCTDACIQGAYTSGATAGAGATAAATAAITPTATVKRVLDIGCGTGLLSLMIAQRHPHALIDAVEIEANAYEQALENIKNSPWAENIRLQHLPVQSFSSPEPYELIIANPPFYPKHLPSPKAQRNQAFHHESLSFRELATACKSLLAPQGFCSILLPGSQAEAFAAIAAQEGLYPWHELEIRESDAHKPHRSIRYYGHQPPKSCSFEKLSIRDKNREYSQAFRQLLQAYYTIF